MPERVTFTVPGKIIGKQRPVVTKTHTFTPKKSVNAESKIALFAQNAGVECTDRPIKLGITAFFAIPKSFSKKKKQLALDNEIRPTKYPDWDNIGKTVADALNGIAYHDDKQVVDGFVRKVYTGREEHLMITIYEL